MFKFFKKLLDQISIYHDTTQLYEAVTNKTTIPSKAYVNWGIFLANTGDIEDALKKFESSSYMRPINPESFNNWGIALASVGRYEEAIQKFRESAKIEPNSAKTFTLWAAALIELNDIEQADKLYQKALELNPHNIETYLNWGVALARRGLKSLAESKFQKALEMQPRSAQASFLLGIVLVEMERYNEAIERLGYSIKQQDKNPEAWHYYAVALYKKGDFEQAYEKAQTAIKMEPAKIEFQINLAEILVALDKYDQAKDCYELAEKTDPDYPDLYSSWGVALQKHGQHEEAVNKMEKALGLKPQNERTMYFLALSLIETDGLERAEELLKQVLEKDARYIEAHVKLGHIAYKKGDFNGAIDKYKTALKFPLKKTGANYFIGRAYRTLNRLQEAREYYQSAIEDDSGHIEAFVDYAIILDELGNKEEAKRKIRRALQLDPNNENVKVFYNRINSETESG